jgi:DNA replicative helicase MCM subunit Mcm2 (Cdc46/Mcm family)
MSERVGKDVPVNDLLTKAEESGMTEKEFEDAMNDLEKQGIIYRSSKGTVSYVDIEL